MYLLVSWWWKKRGKITGMLLDFICILCVSLNSRCFPRVVNQTRNEFDKESWWQRLLWKTSTRVWVPLLCCHGILRLKTSGAHAWNGTNQPIGHWSRGFYVRKRQQTCPWKKKRKKRSTSFSFAGKWTAVGLWANRPRVTVARFQWMTLN